MPSAVPGTLTMRFGRLMGIEQAGLAAGGAGLGRGRRGRAGRRGDRGHSSEHADRLPTGHRASFVGLKFVAHVALPLGRRPCWAIGVSFGQAEAP